MFVFVFVADCVVVGCTRCCYVCLLLFVCAVVWLSLLVFDAVYDWCCCWCSLLVLVLMVLCVYLCAVGGRWW